ncbi:hypothetical protein [Methylobacterium sp. Leaf108]|uniref:TadE/TadG family type IV pilus assembly protein n=1 Tax=Methylobacterium sp. Leaf108 TaxID=1736256 RepID=UPI0006FA3707|nr:hypothetical protein [Methylobacterium sp. Leaf108]KQP58171.1 hypothetical protein ASF39_18410 [Methylobacterium sp. Leaf108]
MFLRDEKGAVIMILALALPALIFGVGGVVETSRGIAYRQRLASAVELSCTQGQAFVNGHKRLDVTSANGTKTYDSDLERIKNNNFAAKAMEDVAPAARATSTDTNINVTATGVMPLIFSGAFGQASMSFTVARDCAVNSTAVAFADRNPSTLLISESFEQPSHTVAPNSWTVLKNASSEWNGWKVQNAGIEINGLRELASNSIRFGDFFAELDSDCKTSVNAGVSNCRTNSAMSRFLRLTTGSYQVRYWYIARERDASRPGQVICGKTSSDVSYYQVNSQTNRIELFVEKEGDYTFNANNMVDVCVQADKWVERVIDFTVPVEANYKITWRAAGKEDSFGGLIDYLRICKNGCPG